MARGLATAATTAVPRGSSSSVHGTEAAGNQFVFDGCTKLEDCAFLISGFGARGWRCWIGSQMSAWFEFAEEVFDVAILIGGERCKRGVVGGKLFEDSLFVGDSIVDVVEVAIQLIEHAGLTCKGGGSCQERSDAMDGCSGVCGTKEITPFIGGVLFAFDGDLGCADDSFPGGPLLSIVGEAVPVWVLFWEAAGCEKGG